jgi:recombination protein RecR
MQTPRPNTPNLDDLIALLAKLPGLGPRSARRITLHLLKKRETLLNPLIHTLEHVASTLKTCTVCGTLDINDPCHICTDPRRDARSICVVEDIADLWALERAGLWRGRYHILGGHLSALDGIGPQDLRIAELVKRANTEGIEEIVLALNATLDGQTTAHVVAQYLKPCNIRITQLAHGVPVGGELDYLDDGTLAQALRARHDI